jgi:hypothetical protein
MSITKSTYTQAPTLTYQDVTISPATLADGTMAVRFDSLAFPQKGVKFAGTHGAGEAVVVPRAPRTTHGAGS